VLANSERGAVDLAHSGAISTLTRSRNRMLTQIDGGLRVWSSIERHIGRARGEQACRPSGDLGHAANRRYVAPLRAHERGVGVSCDAGRQILGSETRWVDGCPPASAQGRKCAAIRNRLVRFEPHPKPLTDRSVCDRSGLGPVIRHAGLPAVRSAYAEREPWPIGLTASGQRVFVVRPR
jgi:hypothetical protein